METHDWIERDRSWNGCLGAWRHPLSSCTLALIIALPISAQQPVPSASNANSASARPADEPFLASYVVPEEQRAATEQFILKFTNSEIGRVAFDQRTGQLIVFGPADIHQQAKQVVAAPQVKTAPAIRRLPLGNEQVAPPLAPENAPPAEVVSPAAERLPGGENSQELRLKTLNADTLHARLEQFAAKPLPASWDAGSNWLSFPLTLTAGTEATVEVNRATGEVRLSGSPAAVSGWRRVIEALDSQSTNSDQVTRLVSATRAPKDRLQRALQVLGNQSGERRRDDTVTMLVQAQPPVAQPAPTEGQPDTPPQTPPEEERPSGLEEDSTLLGPVRIEFVEGLDVIVVEGNPRDVDRVLRLIEQIESLSAETMPAIEILPLEHVDSVSLALLLTQLYEQVLGPRTGMVSITPLGRPNALLIIGRTENVERAVELAKRLDQPVEPESRFAVIPLKHASANDAKVVIDQFLVEQVQQEQQQQQQPLTLAPRALVIADYRSNSLIVRAGPRDMAEIKAIAARLDTNQVAAVDEVKVFQLRNTTAPELAETLREAIAGQLAAGQDGAPGQASTQSGARSTALQFIMIDAETQQRLQSGILTNVRISADQRANSIVVTAPPESMELISALIAQLDRAPSAEAELKVFTIANGDAASLVEMLRGLFGTEQAADAPGGGGLGGAAGALVPLQFSVDPRTNSIIAAGSGEDLAVVEAILLRLDSSDVRKRMTAVYRLKNAPAEDVALALNEWLRTEREAETAADLAISPFEAIEREVIIVPELVSNALIVSATEAYFDEIKKLIEQLDERPPMVMIQVLIAEVRLNDTDEFGVELGLQDSVLFDRSLIDPANFLTITNTTQTSTAAGVVTDTQQTIVNAPLTPGFNFNNLPLGNNASGVALENASTVGAQGLSNFGVNRVNSELGFGGFVFAASSNSVNFLLRALQESRRLEVLSRPQIMALDNQEGIINVGQRIPRVAAIQQNQFGQTNDIIYEQVGIILRVRPRISPDGLVVMEVYANKSEVGPEIEGIPISIANNGQVLRSPRIDNTEATTTVSASSGQTIVLSGLLTKRSVDIHRRVPLIADIPLIGDLFRYDAVSEQRTELLIILTPRIVRDHLDAEMIKQVESSRMSWVLCDVVTMHGPSGLRSRCDEWGDGETCAVYPTEVPQDGELVPFAPTEGPATPLVPPQADPNLPEAPLGDLPRPIDQQISPAGYGYDGPPPKQVRYSLGNP